jgi:hypothetical protein
MKRQLISLCTVLGLLLVTGSAYAQASYGTLKADVPFTFAIANTKLPAGPYTISSIGRAGSNTLLFKSDNMKAGVLIMPRVSESAKVPEASQLVFHRYGGEYFLREIRVKGNHEGRQLPMSRREAEMAKNQANDENTIVVASLR